MFYEFHTSSGVTDIYEYEVLNENQVRFTMKSEGPHMEKDAYTFIDTREGTMGMGVASGTTFGNAVKVKSVTEEYEYVDKVCKGCEIKSQAREMINFKMYDKLTVTKPDGTKVMYFFDITSFYDR